MKKKRAILVSLILAMCIPLTVFGKIEHGFSQGSYKLQKDGSYKLYRTYCKEDGSMARSEWVQVSDDYNAVGVSYYEYYGSDGNILSSTTTPDGYSVNYDGRWYKNCPSAAITETEGSRIEHNGAVFFPFSYDGNVVKNDFLGINLNYNDMAYQNGFELSMRNYTCASYYAAFTIISPTGTTAKISIFPYDASTDEAIQGWVDDEYVKSFAQTSREELIIGGVNLRGYKLIHETGSTTLRLYRPVPGGASWGIEFAFKTLEEEEQLLNWLNTNMIVTN